MKKHSKLKLHRETIAALDPRQLRAAGADCTCTCCPTDAGCPQPTYDYYSCLNSCDCTTNNNEWSCICA